jgi:hypothetical protein
MVCVGYSIIVGGVRGLKTGRKKHIVFGGGGGGGGGGVTVFYIVKKCSSMGLGAINVDFRVHVLLFSVPCLQC